MSAALGNPITWLNTHGKDPAQAYQELLKAAQANPGIAKFLTSGTTAGLSTGDIQTINDFLRGTPYYGQPDYFMLQMQGRSAQANPVATPQGQRELAGNPAAQQGQAQAGAALPDTSFTGWQANRAAQAAPNTATPPANQTTPPPPSSAAGALSTSRPPINRGPGYNDTAPTVPPPAPTNQGPNKAAVASAANQAAASIPVNGGGQGPNKNAVAAAANQAAANSGFNTGMVPGGTGAPGMAGFAGTPPTPGTSTLANNYIFDPNNIGVAVQETMKAMGLDPTNMGMMGGFVKQQLGNILGAILPNLAFAPGNNGMNPDFSSILPSLVSGLQGASTGFANTVQGLGRSIQGNPYFQSLLNQQTGDNAIAAQEKFLSNLMPLLLFNQNDLAKNAAATQFQSAADRIQQLAYESMASNQAPTGGAYGPTNFMNFLGSQASGLNPTSALRSLLGF